MTTPSPPERSSRDLLGSAALFGDRVLAGLILVQAFLAGRHLFGSWSIAVHGVVGNVVFAIAVATAIVTTFSSLPPLRKIGGWVLVALVTTQVGLGYAGRTSLDAASWHIPLGVAAFGAFLRRPDRAGIFT